MPRKPVNDDSSSSGYTTEVKATNLYLSPPAKKSTTGGKKPVQNVRDNSVVVVEKIGFTLVKHRVDRKRRN